MKKILMTILTLGIFFTTTAQSGGAGVHAGLVNTGLFSPASGSAEEFGSNSGMMVGVRYNFKLGPVGLCSELNYVSQRFDEIGEMSGSSLIEYGVPTEYTFNYMSIPLLLKVYLGPINIHGGVQTSFLLGGSIKDDEFNTDYDLDDDEYKWELSNGEEYSVFEDVDVAAVFGVGVDLKIGVYMSARATISLTPWHNMKLINDGAELENMDADDFINEEIGGNDGTSGLDRFITTQFTVGYSF